jgi:tRNA pseudouridine55 synthase
MRRARRRRPAERCPRAKRWKRRWRSSLARSASARPAYSALKVDGERAYALARAGAEVVLAEREVIVHALALTAYVPPHASFAVRCGKGTYVRSLARDIARACGTLGHVVVLRRTGAGPFTLADAVPLDLGAAMCNGPALEQALKPLTAGLDDIPVLEVDPRDAADLRQGRRLSGPRAKPGTYLATNRSVPVALVAVSQEDVRVLRGLNLEGDSDVDRS